MNVKQERHDEAEIQALADKILEASKNRMVVNQQKSHSGGQNLLLSSMMNNDKRKIQGNNQGSDTGKAIDEESVKGRFGWELIGNNPVPYIIRSGEKFCAVRMVEIKALNKYLNYLHQDIYNCTCIRSYYITEPEGRLLNEINFKHCDNQFGREHFTQRDLIVRLSDAIEFYNFLCSCYTKLMNGETDSLGRSGFIRINKESVVPYTVYNEQKYVPLFYFEGETENLKQRANKLEGWDLSYLKFCCKVQGIRNELFAHDSCSVISLNDIKNYFPPGTQFEDYWPKKSVVDSQLLVSGTGRSQSQIIQWTRQPATAPPISHAVSTPKVVSLTQSKPPSTNNQLHTVHSYSTYGMSTQHPYHPAASRTSASTVRSTYANAPNSSAGGRHMRSPNYYANMTQGPPPLVPATQAQSNLHYSNPQSNPASNYMLSNEQQTLSQINYHQEESEDSQPPPMIPIRQFLANGGVLSPNFLRHQQQQQARMHLDVVNQNASARELQNSYNVGTRQSLLINQQPAHQQSGRTASSSLGEEHTMTNGQICDDLNCKLLTIPDPSSGSNKIPYKMQKALVEGKLLPCINMKPYVYTDLLVTLPDLVLNFFNNVPVQSCQRVMKVLGIDLYKPNNFQTQVLIESGKCQSINEVIPLVQVGSVIDFMPQLKYMLAGVIPNNANKRQRTS